MRGYIFFFVFVFCRCLFTTIFSALFFGYLPSGITTFSYPPIWTAQNSLMWKHFNVCIDDFSFSVLIHKYWIMSHMWVYLRWGRPIFILCSNQHCYNNNKKSIPIFWRGQKCFFFSIFERDERTIRIWIRNIHCKFEAEKNVWYRIVYTLLAPQLMRCDLLWMNLACVVRW